MLLKRYVNDELFTKFDVYDLPSVRVYTSEIKSYQISNPLIKLFLLCVSVVACREDAMVYDICQKFTTNPL